MKKDCFNCDYFFECDDKEDNPPDDVCQNFFATTSKVKSNDDWCEMSWNRFTDDLLDYGELTEWEEFVEEEKE